MLTISIIMQIVDSYLCLYLNHVVHRDLKPDNILIKVVDGKIKIKIGDFGLSTHQIQMSLKGPAGTKGYRPHELYECFESYQKDCDIFSIGAIAIFVITNKHPDKLKCINKDNGLSDKEAI